MALARLGLAAVLVLGMSTAPRSFQRSGRANLACAVPRRWRWVGPLLVTIHRLPRATAGHIASSYFGQNTAYGTFAAQKPRVLLVEERGQALPPRTRVEQ
jgi:hypothetical protein